MVSTMASLQHLNLLQVFPVVSLFKLVNAAVILTFSSSLIFHGVLLVIRLATYAYNAKNVCDGVLRELCRRWHTTVETCGKPRITVGYPR